MTPQFSRRVAKVMDMPAISDELTIKQRAAFVRRISLKETFNKINKDDQSRIRRAEAQLRKKEKET